MRVNTVKQRLHCEAAFEDNNKHIMVSILSHGASINYNHPPRLPSQRHKQAQSIRIAQISIPKVLELYAEFVWGW